MYELPKSFKIDCRDHKVLVEALHLMDHMDIRWVGGEKPSEFTPLSGRCLCIEEGKLSMFLTTRYFNLSRLPEVKFVELALAYISEMVLGKDKIKTAFDEDSFVSMLGGGG